MPSFTANTTCDVYRVGNAPPAAPDVSGVPCKLTAMYPTGLERGEGDATSRKFTHVLLVNFASDIRDDYDAGAVGGNADIVYVPDQNGTSFTVVFTEMLFQGTPSEHKRIYLARKLPTWPSNEV